ncbi:MAG TPA: phosphoheptose isomerase, partial [Actinomycetes bacterium]|nr:phosphoheptose isomerase [Actinomycetes bacterium]
MARDGTGVESLYPFLYSGGSNLEDVLDQVRRSTVDKAAEIVELRQLTVHRDAARLADCARAMARSFMGGG